MKSENHESHMTQDDLIIALATFAKTELLCYSQKAAEWVHVGGHDKDEASKLFPGTVLAAPPTITNAPAFGIFRRLDATGCRQTDAARLARRSLTTSGCGGKLLGL